MKVYSIVVTYNGSEWVDDCFGSLMHQNIEEHHIIAVDNGSRDNTVALLKEKFPEVEVVETGENLGFGKANNIGMNKAYLDGADYVFLLNQDAYIEEDGINKLIEVQTQNPEFGVLSPIHFAGGEKEIDSKFTTYLNSMETPLLIYDLYRGQRKQIYPSAFVNAAIWLISYDCIEKTGIFDPMFFHYGEDRDYIYRIKYWGFKLGICPWIKGVHARKQDKEPGDNPIYNFSIRVAYLKAYKKKLYPRIVYLLASLSGLLFSLFGNDKRYISDYYIFKFYKLIKKHREISFSRQGAFIKK